MGVCCSRAKMKNKFMKKAKIYTFDFHRVIFSFIKNQDAAQDLAKKFLYKEDFDKQKATELAFEFLIYVALLDFCFNEIKLPNVVNFLKIQLIYLINYLITFTNCMDYNTKTWKYFIENYLEQTVQIYENFLEKINHYQKISFGVEDNQIKQDLNLTLIQYQEKNLHIPIKTQIGISILEYLIQKGPFCFIIEKKAQLIRLKNQIDFS